MPSLRRGLFSTHTRKEMTVAQAVNTVQSYADVFQYDDTLVSLDPNKEYKIMDNGCIWEILPNGYKLITAGDPNYVKPAIEHVGCYAGIGVSW